MSKLSDFVGGGGGLKPFNDLGTVTGVVDLDVSEFGSFRVKQGAGAITLNVTGKAADTAGYVELFFYPNLEQAVTISGADLIENGYKFLPEGGITSLDYDSVSFDVSAQDTNPYGIAFNNDGSKMYMLGAINDSVHQYTLSTPFDLATASYDSVSLDVSAQDTSPYGIAFNSDGSKMYMVGITNNSVHQYTLSTPFDLSTASYDSVSFSVAGQDSAPLGIAFNNDGSKLYMVGAASDSVHQYTAGYDFGPLFIYQIIHTGTAATFNTLNSDYSIKVAT
jgi:DNA-binding beta-propeller fold protein YncE